MFGLWEGVLKVGRWCVSDIFWGNMDNVCNCVSISFMKEDVVRLPPIPILPALTSMSSMFVQGRLSV